MAEFLDTQFGLYKIGKSQRFFQAFSDYTTNPENEIYWEFFNTRKFRISPKVISSRIMNHWQEKELLPENCQEANQKWRSFTLMDLVWVAVLKELREIEIPIPVIQKIKKSIKTAYNQCEYGELEFYSALAYFKRMPVELLIFTDGSAEIASTLEVNDSKEQYGLPTNISIPINGILQSIFKDQNLQPIYNSWIDLDENEVKVLEKIKSGEYDEVSLTLQNGKVVKLKGQNNSKKELYKIQREGGDQDIMVKMRNGKISHIVQTKIENL
ncbi:hypothetical protein ACF3NR_03355 [Vaginella massiliensis]|uniref:hypothetical protein n=1 Tax=Vaginella massiliensis TaxID=1816680 RepID=UPI00375332D9